MDMFSSSIFLLGLLMMLKGGSGATFTFVNNCEYTVWPGILANSGSPKLESTGFELEKGGSRSFEAPTGWSGRFWGRTSCNFDSSASAGGQGQRSCATGDCGSGEVECNGSGATPPATLAEFTLGSGSQDFYDVSLVDGYNLPMVVEAAGAGAGAGGSSTSTCAATGCVTDLNQQCPAELRVGPGEGEGCKSACEAFGSPEYCCSGAFGSPSTCKPSVYSTMFKSACPRSYSYAYDDATSTFTCTGADYIVTFCPSYANSQKSTSTDETPRTTTDGGGGGAGAGAAVTAPQTDIQTQTQPAEEANGMGSSSSTASSSTGGAMLADASWIAGLATGHSATTISALSLRSTLCIISISTAIALRIIDLHSCTSYSHP